MATAKYFPGDRFAGWVLVERVGHLWRARCDCGHETVANGVHFSRKARACKACTGISRRTVRYSNMPTWRSWSTMRTRCSNSNTPSFVNYGGRGITCCPEWETFEQFFADMGPRPPGYSLDRIDNNLGYSKENCRWATRTQQARNTRVKSVHARDKTIAEAAEDAGLSYAMVAARLNNGWEYNRALSEPKIDYSSSLAARARAAGLREPTVFKRISRGWTEEEALSTPVGVRRS